jgi:lipopolysaccharide export system protein LptA
MIWQRRVRIGLAVAGVACAAAVYLLARDRPSGPAPVSLLPTDRAVLLDGGETTSIRMTGLFEDVLSADSFKKYDDRTWYENPRMVSRDGTTVEADEGLEYNPAVGSDTPGKFELSKRVRVVTEDGLELQAELATYDGVTGLVTLPGDVKIVKGRLTATGVGGLYDRTREFFKIEDQARAVIAPAADGGQTIDASARAMTMARQEHFLRLEENARIARPAEVLAADTATIYFTEATEDLRLVDLSGRATVTPVAGAPNPSPDMRGDTISLMLHPEGQTLKQATLSGNARLTQTEPGGARVIDAAWIDLTTASDGRTLNGLRARQDVRVELSASADGPSRTIRSSTLVASGSDARGLERARFEGGVDFVERPAGQSAPRTGRSRTLVMSWDARSSFSH